jgi:hypothetical protein
VYEYGVVGVIFPIFQYLLFSLKLNAERRLGTPKAPTELAASAVWWGGGPHLWGPQGGVPGGSALAARPGCCWAA